MFRPVDRCWVCGCRQLGRFHACRLAFDEYRTQDPGLAAYTGRTVWLVRCSSCGFGQPEALPTLPGFFDRMYDQRWSFDWIENEFDASYKDFIFDGILRTLASRMNGSFDGRRRLLDVGAHAGRFMHLAQQAGWRVEGIELNPRTAACAARRTAASVHQSNAEALSGGGRRFDAVTLTDVLEHIPEPVSVLSAVAGLLAPGGTIAVKVPCGSSQWHKERLLAALNPSRRVSLADNLVHVNHFTPRSLALALRRAGFAHVSMRTGAPELPPARGSRVVHTFSQAVRLGVYAAGRLPGAVHTPLALHLQAFASLPDEGAAA